MRRPPAIGAGLVFGALGWALLFAVYFSGRYVAHNMLPLGLAFGLGYIVRGWRRTPVRSIPGPPEVPPAPDLTLLRLRRANPYDFEGDR